MKNFIADFGKMLVRLGVGFPTSSLSSFQKWICLRDTLRRLEINCVLDVGANEGQFARILRKIGYSGYILSFEPIDAVFQPLSQTFKNDHFWKGLNIALGSANTLKPLNIIVESTVMSSFLNPRTAEMEIDTKQVKIKRLDSIFDDLIAKIPHPRVFLKIDTQGYDLEVIKGATGCIDNVLGLQSEVSVQPIYKNMPHYLESLRVYESLGFELIGMYEICRSPQNNRVIEYDCIMSRPA